ncbi:MAG: hypothetical protein ABIJ09_02810 [Pseudomonadota bacterium]
MPLPLWVPILGPLLGRRRSFRELPQLAKRWGLSHGESDMRYRFGVLRGSLDGYRVEISPDVPSLTVHFNRSDHEFRMATMDLAARKRKDYQLGHARFTRVFEWMELSPQVAAALRGQTEVFERVLALWTYRVGSMFLASSLFTLSLRPPLHLHFLTVEQVEDLLPRMVETVKLIESVLYPEDPAGG